MIHYFARKDIVALTALSLLLLPGCSGGGTASSQVPAVSTNSSTADTAAQSESQLQAADTAAQTVLDSGRSALVAVNYVNEMPGKADSFVNAIGVDTKFGYTGQPYDVNWAPISAALVNSGIKHLREAGNVNIPTYMSRLAFLKAAGINHSFEALIGKNGTPAKITSDLMAYGPSSVDYVESQNEYDGNAASDPAWATHIATLQKTLWATIKGNPAFSGIKVLGPPLLSGSHSAAVGPLDAYEDEGNMHYATCDFNPGTSGLAKETLELRASTVYKPISTTEAEYGDDMARPCSLTDAIIAKYTPRTITERWNMGEPHIYLFQFADVPQDVVFGATGLVRADGTLKPQYKTMQSMISLLADPHASFAPKALAYSLTGATANVHHTLLQKQDGTYYLLFWQEVSSWDHKARAPIVVAPARIVLHLKAAPHSATRYAYGPNGVLVKKTLKNSTLIALSATDTITFVALN